MDRDLLAEIQNYGIMVVLFDNRNRLIHETHIPFLLRNIADEQGGYRLPNLWWRFFEDCTIGGLSIISPYSEETLLTWKWESPQYLLEDDELHLSKTPLSFDSNTGFSFASE